MVVATVKVNPLTVNTLVPIYRVTCTKQVTDAVAFVLSTTSSPFTFTQASRTMTLSSKNYADEGVYMCYITASMLDGTYLNSSPFSINVERAKILAPAGSLTSP